MRLIGSLRIVEKSAWKVMAANRNVMRKPIKSACVIPLIAFSGIAAADHPVGEERMLLRTHPEPACLAIQETISFAIADGLVRVRSGRAWHRSGGLEFELGSARCAWSGSISADPSLGGRLPAGESPGRKELPGGRLPAGESPGTKELHGESNAITEFRYGPAGQRCPRYDIALEFSQGRVTLIIATYESHIGGGERRSTVASDRVDFVLGTVPCRLSFLARPM